MKFKLVSDYQPTGDQPQAIDALSTGIEQGVEHQTLLGVTGSGKTFTIANVVERVQKPTLVLSHNKTLAAQLYNEFKAFFPDNAIEYFVSYYDYYQPEAYIPSTNTYIEKDLSINDDIEKLRLSATSALLSGRQDVLVVSSVSCLFGMGSPVDFGSNTIHIRCGQKIGRENLLRQLVDSLYSRNEAGFEHGNFRVKGDTVDVFLAYSDFALRITFWGDEIDTIEEIHPLTAQVQAHFEEYDIYPANLFVTNKERQQQAILDIEEDLNRQVAFFESVDKHFEAKRLYERVSYDLEMIRELGHCSGIENYSRYFDGRAEGTRPYCLLDFFPKDFLLVIDESHVTVPQIHAMWGGDHARKVTLVEYGFRLPAAMDNRPLTFDEFEEMTHQTIYVSATPADYELRKSEGVIVEQLIRPTGLLDPEIEVRPSLHQVDDLMEEIRQRSLADERVLVTTLTKRMAEELSDYFRRNGLRCEYIHSDVDTLERVEIMENLRKGLFDVLVGVNLLREGLDLPEVSLVAILDADKEGFLRNRRSLTQTAGRAARNLHGKVIFYADTITESMRLTMDETERRRRIQSTYNKEHHIVPKAIRKELNNSLAGGVKSTAERELEKPYQVQTEWLKVSERLESFHDVTELSREIEKVKKKMYEASKKMDFLEAAQYRDELFRLDEKLRQLTQNLF